LYSGVVIVYYYNIYLRRRLVVRFDPPDALTLDVGRLNIDLLGGAGATGGTGGADDGALRLRRPNMDCVGGAGGTGGAG
jgi:hypothetical protein